MSSISISELAAYAVDELKSGVKQQVISRKIAAFLIETNRGGSIEKFERAVTDEFARRGNVTVTITSAFTVDVSTKQKIAHALGAHDPFIREIIDQEIVGGVKAETSEYLLDLTTAHRLARFTQEVGAK